MKVKATRTGWDGLQRRRKDEVFDWPNENPPSWVEPADPNDAKTAAAVDKARQRAEHARAQREAFGGNQGAMSAELRKLTEENAALRAQLAGQPAGAGSQGQQQGASGQGGGKQK